MEQQNSELSSRNLKNENRNPIQVSARIFSVVETLAEEGAMSLQDLSSRVNLNKSTVHRILTSLSVMGYVREDPQTQYYCLSFKICRIASQVLSHSGMADVARPCMDRISRALGDTVHLVQQDGTDAVYIEKVEAVRSTVHLASMVGKTVPLYRSGVGKAMLADMSPEQVRKIWEDSTIEKVTPNTITSFETLQSVLEEVRKNGYAMDNEENERGVICVAVSLPSIGDGNRYAMSVSVPAGLMSREHCRETVSVLLKARASIAGELA